MQRGFTIIEVLVAAAVLAIGSVGVLAMLTLAYSKNVESRERSKATLLAENVLSELERESRSWRGVMTKPTSGTQLREIYDNANLQWYEPKAAQLYNEVGRIPVNTNEPVGKYRVAYYLIQGTMESMTGGVRVIWSKDAKTPCAPPSFSSFDSLAASTAANARNCDFITLPFSFVRN